ncbi:F-box domain-containing protein [Colletotrichum karsti]|uniref:F-box domain-containing protein n=1 Tax=Colletotrichum karsti TaxID=1095194 RepID=A0A9P6LLF3_9PEZI|nr:F-box domain-containing protein [Colletotrichum karsti]KAF9877170.1 F-box domain-containing protein [Colletotrichum karsti]
MPSAATPDPDAVTPFSKVPVEVLLRISSHLTTPELGNLRLTCKSIEQSMFNTFMREFFTKRQFMLTEDSLQALVDISKSRLSDCLDHVIIGLNYFQIQPFRPHHTAEQNAYRKAYADHRTLVSSGQDVVMLTEAFQNLKNLKTVGIRDYHSRERAGRDGPGATWASYGATTIQKETGIDLMSPMHSEHAQEYANKVMITLFTALGNAGARPSTFEMLRRQQRVPDDDAFNLFTKYLKPKVLPVLEGIKTLILVVNAAIGPTRTVSIPGKPNGQDTSHDYLLRQFLGYMTNLEHLRLNFYNGRGSAEKLLNWLATPAPKAPSAPHPANTTTGLLAPPPPPVFPYLRELNLGFCDLNHKDLVQVVRKFAPTLKSLELYRVTLANQPVHTNAVDQSDQSARYKVNLWSKMLKSLCEIPGLDLEHIMIGLPNQRSFKAPGSYMVNSHVWFHPKDAPDKKLTMESYTGIDWKHYVGALTTRIKMDTPPETDEEEEDDEDDDDEMYDSGPDEDEEFMMMHGYYPDEVIDAFDELEDMLMIDTYGIDPMMF